jgi:hypothetical protein
MHGEATWNTVTTSPLRLSLPLFALGIVLLG